MAVVATAEMEPDAAFQQTTYFTVPGDTAFSNMLYRRAPELETIAADLVADAPELDHLTACRTRIYWRRKSSQANGRRVVGRTARASDIMRMELGCDFTIWLAADTARDAKMSPEQVEAAIFEQLMEIGQDDAGNYIKVKPDLQTFSASLNRYGAWRSDLRAGLSRISETRQRTLFEDLGEMTDEDLADLPEA